MKQASDPFASLNGHKYVSLTTFRKNGKPVPTPVWFVVANGKLYVWTRKQSGKIKRIRNNPNVQLTPCTLRGKILGPTVKGVARILTPNEESAERSMRQKYNWEIRLSKLLRRLHPEDRLYVEIVPAEGKN